MDIAIFLGTFYSHNVGDCCSRLGGVPWELRQALIESFKPDLALADGDCPHCELVTAYGDSEDSPGILLRDCSSAPPPPTRKACRFARLPCLLGGRYLFSLCSSRAHRAAHRGCQERAVTGLAFSLPLFKPRKLRRLQGRLEADGRG
ncbi:hypothetical protein PO909_002733 [Leuciscus waleckii]